MTTELENLKQINKAPEWLTENGYKTLKGGYLLEGETPFDMYTRVATASAKNLEELGFANYKDKFFEIMWKGWLGLATPVAANMGTDRGLPISCYSSYCPDSIEGITKTVTEVAVMSSLGGGTSVYLGAIRPTGIPFGKDKKGKSGGVVPWAKILDSTIIAVNQSSIRRGAIALYLPIEHPDLDDFLRIRLGQGDPNRTCTNVHQGVTISDSFMKKLESGDKEASLVWKKLMKTRADTGEPYLIFIDTANKNAPDCYKENNLKIKASNLCFLEDEYVATKNGLVQIKELENKAVEIFDGKEWITNANFRQIGEETDFVKITLNNGQELVSTLDHRYPLINGSFSKAKDISRGQRLEVINNGNFEVHGNQQGKGAYLKGFLIAEGTIEKKYNKPVLWLYSTKYNCSERLLYSLEELEVTKGMRSDAYCKPEFVESSPQRKVLKGLHQYKESLYSWCTEAKKRLPKEVFTWNKKSKLDFLSGLFDGDGSLQVSSFQKSLQITSIHKPFLLDLQKLLGTFGAYSSISLMKKAGKTDFKDGYGVYKTKDCYRLTITNTAISTLCVAGIKFNRLKNIDLKTKRVFKTKSNIVKSVEFIQFKEPKTVYCTTVDSTSKFMISNGLMSGNCSEIFLHSDSAHSFVCCLSSMNLDKYDEWKDTDAVEFATYFLDGVMQDFINKTKNMYGMERAYNFAVKSRALGLGVLGYHSLLQQKNIPFKSPEASRLNEEIFHFLNQETKFASSIMSVVLGEPEWCKGFKQRNTNLTALAPTVSNSMICSEVSPGIEPWDSNYFIKGSAKGDLIQKNSYLEKLIDSKGFTVEETTKIWESILNHNGSVQHLNFLSDREKDIFKTAREIDQLEIIKQAGARQKYIDQGQSVNLFFDDPTTVDPNYFSKVHFAAYKLGLKSLYYCRSKSKLKGNVVENNLPVFQIKFSKDFTSQENPKEFCAINSELTGEPCSACEG